MQRSSFGPFDHGSHLRVIIAFSLMAGLAACGDSPRDVDLVDPSMYPSDTLFGSSQGDADQPSAWTLRDEFASMASRVPGGFGGIFFDSDGALTILLVEPSAAAEAAEALAEERFIRARRAVPDGERFDVENARIQKASYSYDTLYGWYAAVLREARGTAITISSIRVPLNRIHIGIASEEARGAVEAALDRAGVPPEAVVIEQVAPVQPLQNLASKIRPVPGGVQIIYVAGANQRACTLGPNVQWVSQDTTRAFLVNSHCTKYPFQVIQSDLTNYWQPEMATENHIGHEFLDPPLFACDEHSNGCRNSDAALGLYASQVAEELGLIARPVSRNTGDLTIDSSNPRFEITSSFPWSIAGEIIDKVGRTTGWTGGEVVDGCVTVHMEQYAIRCAMVVAADAGERDSGSPVFRSLSGGKIELRGTLFGGLGSCVDGDDPIYPGNPTRYCDQFAASNLGGIEMDLDPNGTGALIYW